jgi:urate oxidase
VLPTDTQKNTVYAFAKKHGIDSPEAFGLALARHFTSTVAPVTGARVDLEEYAWDRATAGAGEHDHTWVRRGPEVRTAAVTVDATGEHVVGGVKDLVLLKSTGSEFAGFLRDDYTTLAETHDRVMASSIVATWRFSTVEVAWDAVYPVVRAHLIEQFATLQSLALQQTLWHMGTAVLDAVPEICEIRLRAPNKHHFVVDLAPFSLDNPNEVFHADDRPYGLIEATILRDDAPPAHDAWKNSAS